jgi:hypothetical protein
MGKKARMLARQETAPGQRSTQSPFQDVTSRCKAKHDVPYTLRCVLHEVHVINGQSHVDKDGREW